MTNLIIIICIFLAYIPIRIWIYYIDKQNIKLSALAKNWTPLKIKWTPFSSKSSFKEFRERLYRLDYTDENGDYNVKYLKISFSSGLYWQDDE